MVVREFPLTAVRPPAHPVRTFAVAVLKSASAALARLAMRLHAVERVSLPEPVIEFHAEAGAPEGALFVNGRLVGHLPGVSRL